MCFHPVRRVRTFSPSGSTVGAGGGESRESLFEGGSCIFCFDLWVDLLEKVYAVYVPAAHLDAHSVGQFSLSRSGESIMALSLRPRKLKKKDAGAAHGRLLCDRGWPFPDSGTVRAGRCVVTFESRSSPKLQN